MSISVYIGFDSSNYGQKLAYEVCKRSILKYNPNVKIVSLVKSELEKNGLFNRENDAKASTEFTYTRFLVPHLNNYQGIALFCDSDFLYKYDINELLNYYDETKAVMCVKHEQKCIGENKFSNMPQSDYPRKNWSSFMLFNCSHPSCKNLDLHKVNNESPAYLHRMQWCKDEEIGEIPYQYNYLLGYYFTNDAKAIHYTEGGPWHNVWYNNKIDSKCIDKCHGQEWIDYLEKDEGKILLHELNFFNHIE